MPKRVRWVKQSKSYSCGPACIAMVSGIPEQEILDVLGYRFANNFGVRIKNMEWCLDKLGIACSRVYRDMLWVDSKKAILRLGGTLHRHKRYVDRGHYLVYYNGKFYDPQHGIRNNLFHPAWAGDWIKVDRYIDIFD
jgi:hypothetical protein